MGYGSFGRWFLLLGGLAIIAAARPAIAGTRSEAQTLNRILREVEELKADKQQDEQKIQNLEQKVDEIQGQNKQLKEANQKLQTDTGTKIEALQTKVDAPIASSEFGNAFDRYLGSHTFTITGAAGGPAGTSVWVPACGVCGAKSQSAARYCGTQVWLGAGVHISTGQAPPPQVVVSGRYPFDAAAK